MQTEWNYTHCRFGVAVRDVTPPVGIYARSWGAASHEIAEGIHRPLLVSAAVLAPLEDSAPELVLVALDLGWFPHLPDEHGLRADVLQRLGKTEGTLLINLSHTHAGANVNSRLAGVPGAELIQPYLADQVTRAIEEARQSLAPAWLTFGQGRCELAHNRDFWDAEAQRFVCGYNPGAPADDTLLVVRVSGEAGQTRAILFNYACHPTTLAWQNRLLSPDFIGAAREVIERAFDAPAIFLQGASGDLAPRDNYVGDPAIADRNGRQLGYAAAAVVESLPPPGTHFMYQGLVVSGADLGAWGYLPLGAHALAACAQLSASPARRCWCWCHQWHSRLPDAARAVWLRDLPGAPVAVRQRLPRSDDRGSRAWAGTGDRGYCA
jgi:Neutral/alkaline non-lysosomal ceramidase, N-terminal